MQLRKKRQNDAMSPNSSTIISKSPSASKVLGNITLDRLAIQATRTQIQLLLDSVRTRDKEIAMMRHEFVEVKQQWMDELEEVQMIHSRACELHAAEVKEFKSKISGYLAEMRVTRNEHNTLLQQHSLLKESLAECQKSGAGGVLPIASSPVNVTVELPTSSEYARCVVKLQALARGYVTRVHANRERVAMAAKTTGLLVALKEKEQGKSGWYQAPGGDVFYFVRDEQAEWLLAAGPISRSDYDEAIFNANSIGVIGTAKPVHSPRTASGSGRSVALLRKNGAGTATGVFSPLGDKLGPIEPGDVLRKCPFELAVDHEDVKGDLYLSNKTNKLYVAVSVDKLLLESLFAASASYLSGSVGINAGNSSLYTGTVEDSIVTQEDSSSSVI